MGRWRMALGIVTGLLGCGGFEPEHAVLFIPPPEYRAWFEATQACSGHAGDFAKIEWYSVPGKEFACPSGQCVGRWEPDHKIYIAEHWIKHEMVVRHEMLHHLLDREGHPNPPFGVGCPLTWETWRSGSQGELNRRLPMRID